MKLMYQEPEVIRFHSIDDVTTDVVTVEEILSYALELTSEYLDEGDESESEIECDEEEKSMGSIEFEHEKIQPMDDFFLGHDSLRLYREQFRGRDGPHEEMGEQEGENFDDLLESESCNDQPYHFPRETNLNEITTGTEKAKVENSNGWGSDSRNERAMSKDLLLVPEEDKEGTSESHMVNIYLEREILFDEEYGYHKIEEQGENLTNERDNRRIARRRNKFENDEVEEEEEEENPRDDREEVDEKSGIEESTHPFGLKIETSPNSFPGSSNIENVGRRIKGEQNHVPMMGATTPRAA